MLRLLGSVLIIAGCGGLGLSQVLALRRRQRFLEDFVSALELMRAEICTRLMPLPEVVEYLAESAPEGCRFFFSGLLGSLDELGNAAFSELWSAQAALTELSEEERSAIAKLGSSLGRYGAGEQQAAIESASCRIRALAAELRAKNEIQARLWTGLGLSAGVLIAIVLI